MELYQLRSFVAVAEAGHFTRAADRLHISQPALSAQMKALETELELDLFERRPGGVTLTSAGQRLLPEARKVLGAAQGFRDAARALTGEIAGTVSVGTVSDPQFIRIADFIRATVARYPRIEIRFHHEVSGAAFHKVRDGLLDASFYYGDLEDPAVAALPLREITYRIVAPAAWRARIEQASWEQIAAEPWVMTPAISTHYQIATRLFREQGISPTKVVEADDEPVVSSLVESGVGLGLMREDMALTRAQAGTIVIWGDIQLTTTLKFIHVAARSQDPVIQALTGILRELWGVPAQDADAPDAGRKPAKKA